VHLAAILERSEKQALLAKQAQKLIQLLDDSPIVPGQERAPFGRHEEVKDVINDAEAELRAWTPSWQSTEHGTTGSTQAQDEQSMISTATGAGHTSDGTHLAEVTGAPPPTQTHADLHHDPTAAASTTAAAGVPSEAGYTEGSQAPTTATASIEQPHAI